MQVSEWGLEAFRLSEVDIVKGSLGVRLVNNGNYKALSVLNTVSRRLNIGQV